MIPATTAAVKNLIQKRQEWEKIVFAQSLNLGEFVSVTAVATKKGEILVGCDTKAKVIVHAGNFPVFGFFLWSRLGFMKVF